MAQGTFRLGVVMPETIVEARVSDVLRESLGRNRYTILHFYDSGRSGAREALRKGVAIAR